MKNKSNKDSIGIKKFLKIYFGIIDEVLLNSKITHKDLRILIPELKRLPYKYTFKNNEKILSGEIVLVCDDKGTIIPYLSPIPEFDINENYDFHTKKDNEELFEEVINCEDFNTYQLSELCKKYKKDHRIREYRATYRVLKQKKQQKSKKKIYMKRGIKNEEY